MGIITSLTTAQARDFKVFLTRRGKRVMFGVLFRLRNCSYKIMKLINRKAQKVFCKRKARNSNPFCLIWEVIPSFSDTQTLITVNAGSWYYLGDCSNIAVPSKWETGRNL